MFNNMSAMCDYILKQHFLMFYFGFQIITIIIIIILQKSAE